MSMIRRPGVVVNGTHRARTYHYYWCRRCQRSIRTTTNNPAEILCPHCFGQIRHELDVSRPGPLLESHMEPSPGARLLDSLAQMLDPPSIQQQQHQNHDLNENQSGNRRALILLQFRGYNHLSRPVSPSENMVSDLVLEQLIQDSAQNDRPGPPPAPVSAIEALPLVELSAERLKGDESCCPVCKDDFDVGDRVRELPCRHFYHSDCILPWLNIHNTCPVCRYEVQGIPDNNNSNENNYNENYYFEEGYNFEDFHFGGQEGNWSSSTGNWSWMQFFSLRPFSLVRNWAHLCLDFLDDRVNGVQNYSRVNVSRGGSSWWRSWGIL